MSVPPPAKTKRASKPLPVEQALATRESVKVLGAFHSDEAPVLSVYLRVPPGPGGLGEARSRLHSLLEPMDEEAKSDRLGHAGRDSLRADLDQLNDTVNELRALEGRGLAIFACHHAGLYEQIVLPRLVREVAVADETPYLRPLLAVLDESHKYCVAVVDREHAWLYVFWLGQLEEQAKASGRALRDPNFAGWHGYRERSTHNRAEQLLRRHLQRTQETIDAVMKQSGAELLIVGGHQDVVTQFLPFLPPRTRAKVAGTFAIDPSTMSPGRVRERAQEVVDGYERDEEVRLVSETLEQVAAGGFAAAGLSWCALAVVEQAVQLLLVDDDTEQPGQVCNDCGWIGLSGQECPICGAGTRPSADIIEEMAAAVIEAGGDVKHVYAETPLTEKVVAARLRFPVPAPEESGGR